MDLSARTVYLVAYDIRSPRRLQQTRKVMLGFGDPVQLSVFRCELTAQERVELRRRLMRVIDASHDQVLFADLGPADGRGGKVIFALGRAYTKAEHRAMVI